MSEKEISVPISTYQRLPHYLAALKKLNEEGREYISSVAIGEQLSLNASLVKKDLAFVITGEGKPRLGYLVNDLIANIEEFLGYNNVSDAVLVGVGKLGAALLGYRGFENYGLNIVAGFDNNESVVGTEIHGKKVLHIGKLESVIQKLNIKMAILAVPQEAAQIMADVLVKEGIRAIWNFAPTNLTLPDTVAVRNENMASSLAVLSGQLKEILKKEQR